MVINTVDATTLCALEIAKLMFTTFILDIKVDIVQNFIIHVRNIIKKLSIVIFRFKHILFITFISWPES